MKFDEIKIVDNKIKHIESKKILDCTIKELEDYCDSKDFACRDCVLNDLLTTTCPLLEILRVKERKIEHEI